MILTDRDFFMTKDPRFQPHDISWNSETTTRLWRYYSTSPHHQRKYFGQQAGEEVAELLDRKLFGKATEILDFSCGKGDLIRACLSHLKQTQKIYGADMSPDSLRATEVQNREHPSFGGTTLNDRYPLPFDAGRFDLVIATEVVEHLADEELNCVFGEIWRLLVPGGHMFLTTPHQENLDAEKTQCPECGCTFHRWQHIQSWTIDSLLAMAEQHGFRAVECRNIQWGPWLLKCYFKLVGRVGNGIFYIGQKPRGESR